MMSLPRNILVTKHLDGERLFWPDKKMVFDDHKGEPIIIAAGFLSDGLSIPKIFQSVFSKSPHYIYAGVLHDYGYRKDFPHAMSRRQVDRLFLLYMKKYGVGFFTRQVIYRAVRLGAFKNWKKRIADFYTDETN